MNKLLAVLVYGLLCWLPLAHAELVIEIEGDGVRQFAIGVVPFQQERSFTLHLILEHYK